MATPWLGRQLLLRGVASAPPAPPTPLLGGVAGGRASLLRELTSPTRRLRGAASDGITSSPTQRSGNWWQHGPTASTTRRCRRVPLLLDAGPKTQQAGVESNICMIPRGCTVWEGLACMAAQCCPTNQNAHAKYTTTSSLRAASNCHIPQTNHEQAPLQPL